MPTEYQFACKIADVPPDGQKGFAVQLGEERIAIFAYEGEFFAVQDRCPHQGAPLSDGHIDKGVLYCDWHYWQFDIRGGKDPNAAGDSIACYHIDTYPVEVRGEELWVRPRPR